MLELNEMIEPLSLDFADIVDLKRIKKLFKKKFISAGVNDRIAEAFISVIEEYNFKKIAKVWIHSEIERALGQSTNSLSGDHALKNKVWAEVEKAVAEKLNTPVDDTLFLED